MDNEQLIYYGGAVKALGNGKVGGYLVRFTGPDAPDLEGDYFTADTDFDLQDGLKAVSVYYQHGLDETLKNRRIGRGTTRADEVGLWLEAQLDLRDEYEQAIYSLIEQGRVGWSSGAVGHLVERQQKGGAHWIKTWPIGEASITPTPAEYRNGVLPLKSLLTPDTVSDVVEAEQPETAPEARKRGDVVKAAEKNEVTITIEEIDMSEETKHDAPETNERLDYLEEQLALMGDNITKVLGYIEDSPPVKNAGYFTVDGGTADPHVKSFGDFLLAIARGDHKRLVEVYKSTKDVTGDTGATGGYLVPEDFSTQLINMAAEQSPILSRCTRVPVGTGSGQWPSLDMFTAPTAGAGNTALAAGVVATGVNEGGTLTETTPAFKQLNWRAKKLGGYTEVTEEMMVDSAISIETLLTMLFGMAIQAKKERNVIRGSGSDNEYLGILNAACTIAVTTAANNVFAWADVLNMIAQFKQIPGPRSAPVWIIHQGVWPDIGVFEVGTAGAGIPSGGASPEMFMRMPGTPWPIIISEHMPAANTDDVILADLSAYLIFERRGLQIAYSEHASFTKELGTWRFSERSDGMPWLTSTITLADPGGATTVSPFLYHND